MTEAIVLDAAILIVFFVSVFLGWKRGLFRSLGELVVVFLALILAQQVAAYAAPQVIDRVLRPATYTAIEEKVDVMLRETETETSQYEEMEQVLEAIPSEYIRERTKELLQELGLSLETKLTYSARDTLVKTGKEVADKVLDTAVLSLAHAVIYLAGFLVIVFVLRLILSALDLTMRLPLLKQVNQAGGLVFGGLKGAALVCLGVWLLVRMGLVINQQVVDRSYVLCRVIQWAKITGVPAG